MTTFDVFADTKAPRAKAARKQAAKKPAAKKSAATEIETPPRITAAMASRWVQRGRAYNP